MNRVFVDTAYFIDRLHRTDQWHEPAVAAYERLGGDTTLVTTDEMLGEVLTALSNGGASARRQAVALVRDLLDSSVVQVVPQSHQSFLDGLALYEQRPDKSYSLQDCISMNVMEAEGITEILTSDHNFEQEGFTVLMRQGS